MELDLLSSRINLSHTCLKLQVSIEDIKAKNPHRTDLITSMEQSLQDIKKAIFVYTVLEKEFRSGRQSNFRLEKLNLEQALEIKDLKKNLEFKDLEL